MKFTSTLLPAAILLQSFAAAQPQGTQGSAPSPPAANSPTSSSSTYQILEARLISFESTSEVRFDMVCSGAQPTALNVYCQNSWNLTDGATTHPINCSDSDVQVQVQLNALSSLNLWISLDNQNTREWSQDLSTWNVTTAGGDVSGRQFSQGASI